MSDFMCLIGKKVQFAYQEDGFWWYLRGEIKQKESFWYLINVEDAYKNTKSLLVPSHQIIEVIDIRKTGHPEELCQEFRMAGSKHEKSLIEVFTNGFCYFFAQWLQSHLLHSEILYLDWEHHYVVWYQKRIFDITGDVTDIYSQKDYSRHRYYGDWKGKGSYEKIQCSS